MSLVIIGKRLLINGILQKKQLKHLCALIVQHLIFHPGGKKIVQTVEALFGSLGKNIDDTKEVLKRYGNMSSVTVLYVLEQFLGRDIKAGDKGLMLSFGPGFSAQRVLLEW